MRARTLVIPAAQHSKIETHLFPGDGKEAAAILLCRRVLAGGLKLLLREVILIPHDQCVREVHRLTWPGSYLDEALAQADTDDLTLILMHSHPTGYFEFSALDDESDLDVMPSLFFARRKELETNDTWHGSAIMVPGGRVKARLYNSVYQASAIDLVAIYGDDIRFFWSTDEAQPVVILAFSDEMTLELGKLSVAVIGISGTGSVVGEQLLRMGVGEVIAVDHDQIEHKNLNRIINSTHSSANVAALKVDVFKEAASRIRPAARVVAVPEEIGLFTSIEAAAAADILFCCVDSEEGRHICDRLSAAMLQPMFDMGVTIPVRRPERGLVISNICGRVDYVQPAGSRLLDRGVYSPQSLAAEELRKSDPATYAKRVQEGYMPGAGQEAPSVISVNMRAASAAVQELIARAYPYRLDHNSRFARTEFDLVSGEQSFTSESSFPHQYLDWVALGLSAPLLGLPSLQDAR